MPLEELQTLEIIQKSQECAPDKETWDRLYALCEGKYDQDSYDCGRSALYIFGFIDKPSDAIPPWERTTLRLEQIDAPEPWALAIYQEQVFNHTGIVLSTGSSVLVFSKHGVGGDPQVEDEQDILEYYPNPLYFRVLPPESESVSTIDQ